MNNNRYSLIYTHGNVLDDKIINDEKITTGTNTETMATEIHVKAKLLAPLSVSISQEQNLET